MAEVIVRGECGIRCLPDRALLHVGVEGQGNARDDAYTRASKAAAAVDAVLERYVTAIDRSMTTAVVVRPRIRWKNGESVTTGWLASRTTRVEVEDFARLGDLISELPAAGASSIDGPSWQVDPANPAYDSARRGAAQDARQRAASYAEALGLRLGPLSWISEPGLRLQGAQLHSTSAGTMRAVRATAQAATEEPMEIAPDEVTITASVEAGFQLIDGPPSS